MTKHGHGGDRKGLYVIWCGMKNRCLNQKHPRYKNYGGKGVRLWDEWKNDFMAFRGWALKNGYEEGLSIDRIDNDGDYEPSNCQWLTREDNCRKQCVDAKKKRNPHLAHLFDLAHFFD